MSRKSIIFSVVFHVLIVAVSYMGLPALRDPLPLVETPMMVELVTIAEKTNAPPPPPRKPKSKKKTEAKRIKPPAPPKSKTPPPPPPPPTPSQDTAALAPPPPPKAKAKKKPPPKPKAKPEPKPKVEAPPQLTKAKPRRKPKPPDNFASVLKTLEELERSQSKKKDDNKKNQAKKKPEEDFDQMMAKALQSQKPQRDPMRPLTISQIDYVRQQIARCWNLPAGAKDAENLVIEIKVLMNPDGTVQQANIQNQARMLADGFFRAAAESALRAVLNPRCQPFKLPRDKYNIWQTMTLTFNPREMFGV
ncbi:MAG: hypothetical protein ACO3MW_04695 [Rhodospirillales bacterium]